MNNNIKLIDTGKCNILAVMVPGGTIGANITKLDDGDPDDYLYINYDDSQFIKLPEGEWQILGISTEVTEGQWRELMLRTKSFLSGVFPVFHYSGFETAKESGLSLLESNGIFSVNPYGEKAPIVSDPDPSSQYYGAQMDEMHRWQQAQENTGPRLILNNISKV